MDSEADSKARTTAWYRCVGAGHRTPPESMSSRLRDGNVDIAPAESLVHSAPGILWLSGTLDDAVDALRELNPDGLTRVLAVPDSGATLAVSAVWRLVNAGASDVISWNGTLDAADAISARLRRWSAVDSLLAAPAVRSRLVGSSPVWIAMLRQLVEAAAFTDASILLTGESGVGKEEAARIVHSLDRRRDKRDLVVLDCTTVVPELSGSEFFGHERGAFTGAVSKRDGAFALADGGTLFLDEVGELAPALQTQLLRVIQDRTFKRVGADAWQHTSFRLVCATNRDPVEEVANGRFRRDLYHRIAACSCTLPSLRSRTADILPLSYHFLREVLPAEVEPALDPAVQEFLVKRDYPGNVRELRQVVLRMGKRHVGRSPITVGDIPHDELGRVDGLGRWPDARFDEAIGHALAIGIGLKEIGRVATDTAMRLALHSEDGNLQRAARRLGVTDRALQLRRAQQDAEKT